MKNLAIIGCTGSIGTQTLDIVRANKSEYNVVALSCGSNDTALISLAKEFNVKLVGISDSSKRAVIKEALPKSEVVCGDDALTEIAACDADIIVIAVVGMIGLKAVASALKHNKVVALANKESLVAGGAIVNKMLEFGGEIRPVDSEHSAVWQSLIGEKAFKRIILTASGGPFWGKNINLDEVTPEQAVAHPNWKMGKKISVDSATMMNKGLEIIEARWLFNTTDIDYVIHPESVVHSMVEFDDGSIKAQASYADMRLPIQYALSFPCHAPRTYKPLSLPLSINFCAPDTVRFPAPELAKKAMQAGGDAAVVLNAANEAAVRLFLERKIKFTDIIRRVSAALDEHTIGRADDIDAVFDTHNRVYEKIYSI
ncbi:MAG: 1-deoxy-D-xylulose-5-phosphate reductoisomerase [Clostridiales bacterium]|nr:1-deoxy-D-xylulose-5-phosphate reductoisomerase [Clostridiales bacterium]